MAGRERADQGPGASGVGRVDRALGLFTIVIVVALGSACSAGYQGRVLELNKAISQGDEVTALEFANAALGVDSGDQMPAQLDGDYPLLLLERATLLQANGDHKAAVRDFKEADSVLEVLDLSGEDDSVVGKYLFSDDATTYQVPPHEKLLINTLAMISYLCMGDLSGAKVEARRLTVLQKYFKDAAPEELTLFGLGSYMAGFIHEKDGDYDSALRYYLEAYREHGFDEAKVPIAYLAKATGYESEEVTAIIAEVGEVSMPGDDVGELLVFVQNGRAPYKVAERIPIGAFLTVRSSHGRYHQSPEQRAASDRLVAKGILKFINFPELKVPGRAFTRFDLNLGGRLLGAPGVELNVQSATLDAWENDKPSLMFAAFSRMVTRAIAAEASEAVGEGAGLDKKLFPGASLLLGLVVEGTLAANDTPDTRSWTTLPANIKVYRKRIEPGTYDTRVTASNPGIRTLKSDVTVPAGGYGAVNFRFLR